MAETPLITVRIPEVLLEAAHDTAANAGITARDAGRIIRAALMIMVNTDLTHEQIQAAFDEAKLTAGWAARRGSTP